MTEVAKPPLLAQRGGCWFTSGVAVLHLGVEEPFAPARKAHPAFLVTDLDALAAALVLRGDEVTRSDGELPGIRRFHAFDPFGHRLEFQQA
jgi:predicted enzyme related to lactoylglutathione lyase